MDKIILQSCFFSWPHPYFVAKTCNDKKKPNDNFSVEFAKKNCKKTTDNVLQSCKSCWTFSFVLKMWQKKDKIAKTNIAINVRSGKLCYQCKKWIFKQFCYQWHMQLLLSYHCYSFRIFYLFRIRSYHWLAY